MKLKLHQTNYEEAGHETARVIYLSQLIAVPLILAVGLDSTSTLTSILWGLSAVIVIGFCYYRHQRGSSAQNIGKHSYWLNLFSSLVLASVWCSATFLLIPDDISLQRGILGFFLGIVLFTSRLIFNTKIEQWIFILLLISSMVVRSFISIRPEPFLLGLAPGIIGSLLIGQALDRKKTQNTTLRFSLILAGIFCLTGSTKIYQMIHVWTQLTLEANRQAQSNLATHIATRLQPFTKTSLDLAAIDKILYSFSSLNNKLDIYLLDANGKILASALPSNELGFYPDERYLDIKHIKSALLLDKEVEPLLLDFSRKKIESTFSLASLNIGEKEGYVCVMFKGQLYELYLRKGWQRYVTFLFLLGSMASLFPILAVGYFTYKDLTRRVQRFIGVMREFELGDFSRRLTLENQDEISDFARAVNQMADVICQRNKELELQDFKRRQLVLSITNDLQNPLEEMGVVLENIKNKLSNGSISEILPMVNATQLQVMSQSQLVQDLFELSKLEGQKTILNQERFALDDLLQDILLLRKPMMKESEIELVMQMPEKSVTIEADLNQIARALSAVLDHLLTYLKHKSKLSAVLTVNNKIAQIAIQGCSAEAHLLDNLSKSSVKLDIAARIFELHNATFENQNLTEGRFLYSISFN